MEYMDLSAALAAKEASGDDEDFETPEIYWIVNMLPGTSRYLFCTTITHAIGIWDLHHRRCARVIDTGCVILSLFTSAPIREFTCVHLTRTPDIIARHLKCVLLNENHRSLITLFSRLH